MTMNEARLAVVVTGVLLPYLARIPGGQAWLMQYFHGDGGSHLFLGAFNAITWVIILFATLLYRRVESLLVPAICGFSVLAFGHGTVDLMSSSTAAISLIWIPVFAAEAALVGALGGLLADWCLPKHRWLALAVGVCALLAAWYFLWAQGTIRWPVYSHRYGAPGPAWEWMVK